MIKTYEQAVGIYEDKPHIHRFLMEDFVINVLENELLNEHREYVIQHRLGWGEKAFHWMWKLIVDTLPEEFRFLEIGVFRGQVTSLVNVLGRNKRPEIYGICPDLVDQKAMQEYSHLAQRYQAKDVNLIIGPSQNAEVIQLAREKGPYNVIFIDGSHEYEDVIQDIDNYLPMLKREGLLVMDDASCFLSLNYWFKGEMGSSKAVHDRLLPDKSLREELVICHNRIFRKIT